MALTWQVIYLSRDFGIIFRESGSFHNTAHDSLCVSRLTSIATYDGGDDRTVMSHSSSQRIAIVAIPLMRSVSRFLTVYESALNMVRFLDPHESVDVLDGLFR